MASNFSATSAARIVTSFSTKDFRQTRSLTRKHINKIVNLIRAKKQEKATKGNQSNHIKQPASATNYATNFTIKKAEPIVPQKDIHSGN